MCPHSLDRAKDSWETLKSRVETQYFRPPLKKKEALELASDNTEYPVMKSNGSGVFASSTPNAVCLFNLYSIKHVQSLWFRTWRFSLRKSTEQRWYPIQHWETCAPYFASANCHKLGQGRLSFVITSGFLSVKWVWNEPEQLSFVSVVSHFSFGKFNPKI